MKPEKISLTVNEKIMIHLLKYTSFRDKIEVPCDISQAGLADIIGVRRSHIALALKALKEKELVEEKKARVRGEKRRRKVYILTQTGMNYASQLEKSLHEKELLIKDKGEEKWLRITEVNEHLGEDIGLLEIINNISEEGVFDVNLYREKKHEVIKPSKLVAQPPEEEAKKEAVLKKSSVASIGVGLLLILISSIFIMAGNELIPIYIIGTNVLCLLSPLGFIFGLIFLFLGLREIVLLEKKVRTAALLTGSVLAIAVVSFFLMIFDLIEISSIKDMVLIIAPVFAVLIFGKPIPKNVRSEISIILGIFLILFGISTSMFSSIFNWSRAYSPYWVIFGSISIIVSFEMERLEISKLKKSICASFGIFIILFSANILATSISNIDVLHFICVIVWLSFGSLLISTRFVNNSLAVQIMDTLRSSILFGIGLLFLLFAVVLLIRGKYAECVIEFLIGLPVAKYGLSQTFQEKKPLQLGITSLVVSIEILTTALLLWV